MRQMKHATLAGAAALAAVLSAGLAQAAEKWDMPLAYAASNYHSENAARFAAAVTAATGGELEIVTHASGSLFKGGEIFRAVRTGQAPIGERLISALGNEDPLFEIDALPFLATSFAEARKLYAASRAAMDKTLEEKGVKLLYAVPWPPQGLYNKQPVNSAADMKGTILVTLHRRESFGQPLAAVLRGIRDFLEATPGARALWPVHPNPAVRRTAEEALRGFDRIRLVPPLDYAAFASILAG